MDNWLKLVGACRTGGGTVFDLYGLLIFYVVKWVQLCDVICFFFFVCLLGVVGYIIYLGLGFMKLFFCTNSASMLTSSKWLLFKAIDSALATSFFEVFLVFDGVGSELGLGGRDVCVIEHRHRLHDVLVNTSRRDIAGFNTIISGTFLRTEIPFLCAQRGFTDEFVLYCDYDVLFNKTDFSGLLDIRPEVFAVAPESRQDDFKYFNTGVMLMNLKSLLRDDRVIRSHILKNVEKLEVFDQSMYNRLYGLKYSRLPVEYNWKPYWGINPGAKIIHFHGAKPLAVEPPERSAIKEVADLREINAAGYDFYNKMWDDF